MTNNKETFSPLISSFVNEQVPEFVRQNHPRFVEYLKAYYEFLETSGNPVGRIVDWADLLDVDTTTDEFFAQFKSTYLSPFPEEFLADRAHVVKHIKDLYAAKGTLESFKVLFRILYGEEISVFLPKTKILRASDGKWQINYKMFVEVVTGDKFKFGQHSFIGETSGATVDVDYVEEKQVGTFTVLEMFIIQSQGTFIPWETIHDQETSSLVADVLGFVNDVQIINSGDDYSIGDNVVIADVTGVNANVIVSDIDSTFPINSFTITNGGNGYRVGDKIDFSQNGGIGFGAIAEVSNITITASTSIMTSTIGEFQNTLLSSVAPIVISTFGTTTIIDTGIITGITILDDGRQYTPTPFNVDIIPVTPTLGISAGTNADILANTANTGKILSVTVNDNGVGYSTSTTADFTGTGDGLATGTVNITGGPLRKGGSYKNTDGQLSSDMILQDNVYWQNYSYEINSGHSINEWRDTVKAITHPAGYALFGNMCIQNQVQNPIKLNVEPVDKCILKNIQSPINLTSTVDICYWQVSECQEITTQLPIIANYATHPISIYAGITLQDFFGITLPSQIIANYATDPISLYANVTLQEFIGVNLDPCYTQRRSIIDLEPFPFVVSVAEGFRSTKGIPVISAHQNQPISEVQDVQLFDFFNIGHPFIDQYQNTQVNLLRDTTLETFYTNYTQDEIYRQCRTEIIIAPV